MNFRSVQSSVCYLNLNKLTLKHGKIRLRKMKRDFVIPSKQMWNRLTILLDSELVAVFADPKDLKTVKAAAKCLKASVSRPPPATANSCLSNNIEA